MIIGNILPLAMSLCGSITATYIKFEANIVNDIGVKEPSYSEPITIAGNFQTLDKDMYTELGLDFKQIYYSFWTSNNLQFIGPNTSSDILEVDGHRYQIMSRSNWYEYNGWVGVTCVRI